MPFDLPPLRFEHDALAPWMAAETLRIHHNFVHRAYLDALNATIAPYPELADRTVEDLLRGLDDVPMEIRDAVREQAGAHANHQFFWKIIGPHGGAPGGNLLDRIVADFGSVEGMKAQFAEAALALSGSGRAFLVVNPRTRGLEVLVLSNNDSVLQHRRLGLLACDLWEHASFAQYWNRRRDWVDAFWHVVDWPVVATRLQGIRDGKRQL